MIDVTYLLKMQALYLQTGKISKVFFLILKLLLKYAHNAFSLCNPPNGSVLRVTGRLQ